MKQVAIDAKHTWLTEGLHAEFDTFIPIGTKEAKAKKGAATDVIFKIYSAGVKTNRDAWTYNFNQNTLAQNVQQMIEVYNTEIARWIQQASKEVKVDDFVVPDDTKIKWSSGLKSNLKNGKTTYFSSEKVRISLYRPFTKMNFYFDRMLTERVYVFPSILPTSNIALENRMICVSGIGSSKLFHALVTDTIPCVDSLEKTQCFPFYTYNEDGTNRQENITDWALAEFRTHYNDDTITKWDIFHYTYALLHHPAYREKYEMNLKRDLPHIPFTENFWGFANAGAQLADLHINYESAPKDDGLKYIETPGMKIDWRVEKMNLSKDKTQLRYNDFLTLDGIPAKAYDYKLGNRSALEWVTDQYRVKVDKRSGIVNDPNREAEPRYIVDLIASVITISLKTVEIVKGLPPL